MQITKRNRTQPLTKCNDVRVRTSFLHILLIRSSQACALNGKSVINYLDKHDDQCCKIDGGRPSVDAVQAESTNRLKVLKK